MKPTFIPARFFVTTLLAQAAAVGLLAAETPANTTPRQALGHEETIQRSNIAGMTSSRLSLMPDELEKSMTRQDLADLPGFLQGL